MVIPAGVIVAWPSTVASIPSGWTRVAALDDKFVKVIPNDATNPGTTGGAATHSHTTPAHSHTISHTHSSVTLTASSDFQSAANSGGTLDAAATGHTHTSGTVPATADSTSSETPSTNAASSDPANLLVIYIESNGSPTGIPDGALAFFNNASLPASWALYTDARLRFLKGAVAAGNGGATGGAATHTHTGSHTHTSAHIHPTFTSSADNTSAAEDFASSTDVAREAHTHQTTVDSGDFGTSVAANFTVSTDNHEPAHQKLAIIENQTGGDSAPISIITMWLGTLASIPSGWVLCDGVEAGTPDAFGLFIKGADTTAEIGNEAGAVGHDHTGNGTHTHTWSSTAHTHVLLTTGNASLRAGTGSGVNRSEASHFHTVTSGAASAVTVGTATPDPASVADDQPPFVEVALIMLVSVGPSMAVVYHHRNRNN